jgi:hypothetical protein
MAQFNLEDYETVASRIAKLYERFEHARIITKNLTTEADRARGTWVVQAEIYLPMFSIWIDAPAQDYPEASWYLKSTGLAFEIDGAGMANKTSALENCETSAIGRALANMGLSGDQRASREEMAKVQRGVTPNQGGATPARDWITEAQGIMNTKQLRDLYNQARQSGAGQHILAQITDYAKALEESTKA